MKKPHYFNRLSQILELGDERSRLEPVAKKFAFRTNDYYLKLIDWSDPDDPIRRIVIPSEAELDEWGWLDASREDLYTRVPGLEHKYDDTAVLLVNDVCGGYCRFCFRKRILMEDNDEVVRDIAPGLNYIRQHPEISNVLLSGGDPLVMATSKLEPMIRQISDIPHVRIIRIGSKMPAYNPFRVTADRSLWKMLKTYSTPTRRIYLMVHFNHPRELTPEAREAIAVLQRCGTITCNQTPLIRGVNDDVETLAELLDQLSFMGVAPYYVFQCRPTLGNKTFSVPIERGHEIFTEAQGRCSGLANRTRFCMSHVSGKIEVVGLTSRLIVMRYHRAADPQDSGRVIMFRRDPQAHWFDDYPQAPIPTVAA